MVDLLKKHEIPSYLVNFKKPYRLIVTASHNFFSSRTKIHINYCTHMVHKNIQGIFKSSHIKHVGTAKHKYNIKYNLK